MSTLGQIEAEAVQMAAMPPAEAEAYTRARLARCDASANDKRRREALAGELERLRAEAMEISTI
jgi:hypothetical protein